MPRIVISRCDDIEELAKANFIKEATMFEDTLIAELALEVLRIGTLLTLNELLIEDSDIAIFSTSTVRAAPIALNETSGEAYAIFVIPHTTFVVADIATEPSCLSKTATRLTSKIFDIDADANAIFTVSTRTVAEADIAEEDNLIPSIGIDKFKEDDRFA